MLRNTAAGKRKKPKSEVTAHVHSVIYHESNCKFSTFLTLTISAR